MLSNVLDDEKIAIVYRFAAKFYRDKKLYKLHTWSHEDLAQEMLADFTRESKNGLLDRLHKRRLHQRAIDAMRRLSKSTKHYPIPPLFLRHDNIIPIINLHYRPTEPNEYICPLDAIQQQEELAQIKAKEKTRRARERQRKCRAKKKNAKKKNRL